MVSNQQFRLKWNNHRNTVLQEFETLLHNNSFVDCTIGADGKYLKAHKIVLSACSPYLQNVFSEHFDKHPVILLKDVSFKELKCMIDYMYCGEVNISECELPSFLRTAQSLKIKGLAEDINEYDDSGASDNEHQEISSLTENGRTVEPSVEIHDDEGPPIKRSAPSLIYSNFAGRKRKSPNAISSGTPKSSNNGDKVIAAPTSKTGGNVPSCADTDNSDSTVCTTSKDSSVNKDDNDKKSNSQDDLQEHKNKAVVKEEPLDADDDNSSYEFVNNPCDDSDPLNEDSESNCANSGKNFNEVSIANVSSCNEAEANDGDHDDNDDGRLTKVKEELLISEVVTISPDGTDEGKIRVRSSEELMSSPGTVPINTETAIYIISGPPNDEEILGESDVAIVGCGDQISSNVIDSMPSTIRTRRQSQKSSTPTENPPSKVVTRFISSGQGYKKMKFFDRAKKYKTASIRSKEATEKAKSQQPGSFRKILPAPSKSASLLPLPVTLAASTLGSASYPSNQNQAQMTPTKRLASADASSVSPASTAYRMVGVSSPSILPAQISQDGKRKLPKSATKEENSQPILLSRVVLLNSPDMQSTSSQPVYALPRISSTVSKAKSKKVRQVAYIQAASTPTTAASSNPVRNIDMMAAVNTSPAIASVAAKFRKIAPLPEGGVDNMKICTPCTSCMKLFTDRNELGKHMTVCGKKKA